ncbi:MAG: phage major capsid protein [Eubacteriales bacterium]|nr:phage major capsid protein [Eubacteriales bacterium]
MALKQLMLRKKLEAATAEAAAHRSKRAALDERKTALTKREQEAETALNELNADSTQEERGAVETEASAIDTDQAALDQEIADHEAEQTRLDGVVSGLETEVQQLDERSAPPQENNPVLPDQRSRKEPGMLNRTKFYNMSHEERSAFFAREEIKNFISQIRSSCQTRGVANTTLTIPDVMLEVLRDNMTQYSKLVKHVNVKHVKGKARQNIMGAIPEAVWIEAVGTLNELDLSLNQIEVDGYMIGGWIPISNVYLEDSDLNLGAEIMDALGKAIGLGLDRAILYGTGVKMPLGVIPRLNQTAQPSNWEASARPWTDLHESNIKKISVAESTGAAFFIALIKALSAANPLYSDGKAFWVMNRATHMDIKAKALAFIPAALLTAGDETFPVIGGTIEELEFLGDNEIVGGFGSLYLLSEREGQKIESSEHVKFLENQTVFKGYARYDGKPVIGEGFVLVSYDNTDAATSAAFPVDYANTPLGVLGVTAAAGTDSGNTVLTVSGTETAGTTLKFRIGDFNPNTGDKVVGYTALTSGVTQIACAAGKLLTVVELDTAGRVIKSGKAVAVPKA